jgi:hypothetical protein
VLDKRSKGAARQAPTKEQLAAIAKILGHNPSRVTFYARSTKKKRPNEPEEEASDNENADGDVEADGDAEAEDAQPRASKEKSKTKAPKDKQKRAKGRNWQIGKLSPSSANLNKFGKHEYEKYILAVNAYPDDQTHSQQVQQCFMKAAKEYPRSYEKCEFLWMSVSTCSDVLIGSTKERAEDRERLVCGICLYLLADLRY